MVKYIIYWYKVKNRGKISEYYISYLNYSNNPLKAKQFNSISDVLRDRTDININSVYDISMFIAEINKDKNYSRVKKINKLLNKKTNYYSPDFWFKLRFRIDKIVYDDKSVKVSTISMNELEEELMKVHNKINTVKHKLNFLFNTI